MLFAVARFSALQRAEIAEMLLSQHPLFFSFYSFSALQRAEIAEIIFAPHSISAATFVSVLFNEPKLLKLRKIAATRQRLRVSVLFNEPKLLK